MRTSKFSIQDICSIALFTAVIAIMAQISIPMPLGVPMTMQTFAITLAAVVLGSKRSFFASLAYLLLGMIGVPVFYGFTGGAQHLFGATGGFLISFPLMAFVIGLGVDKFKDVKGGFVICIITGTILNYVVGVIMFCLLTGSSVTVGVTACVIPFIPTAIIKAVAAAIIGLQIRKRLVNVLYA